METQATIDARVLRVQDALEQAFGVRARSLSKALRRTGLRLPKRLHADVRMIADAQAFGGHPKLLRQVDSDALRTAEDKVVGHLKSIDRADRRKGVLINIAAAIALNLLLVLSGLVIWMFWAGYI